jgi:hypothetical protein
MWKSATVVAIALFLAINIGWASLGGPNLVPGSANVVDRQFAAFRNLPRKADVVLMGSSTMLSPFQAMDLRHGAPPATVEESHQGGYLQERLTSAGSDVSVYNLAVKGAMVTDALLIADKMLSGEHKPGLIVYGICPRDFVDAMLSNEVGTDTYSSLFELPELVSYAPFLTGTSMERTEFCFRNLIPLYGRRHSIQSALARKLGSECRSQPIASVWNNQTPFTRKNTDKEQIAGCIFRAAEVLDRAKLESEHWRNSIRQYALRYFCIDPERVQRQSKALNRMLALCKRREIPVLVVNMPLTQDNVDLLDQTFYAQYLSTVESACAANHADFLNLQNDPSFNRASYTDIVHLNDVGAVKLVDSLWPRIAKLRTGQACIANQVSSR